VTGQNGFGGALDRATVSSTGNAVAQALSGGNVYNQKVAALQQSIMAGTYSVPASDVAAKVLSVMLH
jgi:anti-sigma28 factor (negative regulator of flagellin synthesis)